MKKNTFAPCEYRSQSEYERLRDEYARRGISLAYAPRGHRCVLAVKGAHVAAQLNGLPDAGYVDIKCDLTGVADVNAISTRVINAFCEAYRDNPAMLALLKVSQTTA